MSGRVSLVPLPGRRGNWNPLSSGEWPNHVSPSTDECYGGHTLQLDLISRFRLGLQAASFKDQRSGRDLAVLFLLAIGVAVLHTAVPGPVPSGGDGGNWLALAHEHLGVRVMSAEVNYPPAFPSLVAALLLIADPIVALVIGALVAKAAPVLATYWCCRSLGRQFAAGAAVMVGVAGSQLEAYAWGGYPQLLATGFGLMGTYFVVNYVGTARPRDLVAAIVFVLAAFSTHNLIAGLLVMALPLCVVHRLWMLKASRRLWRRGLWVVALVAVPGALYMSAWLPSGGEGMQAVINPLMEETSFSLVFTIRDAPLPWILVAGAGLAAILRRGWPDSQTVPVAVGTAWAVAGAAFFVVTGERRALLLTQVGIIVLAILTLRRWLGLLRLRDSRLHHSAWAALLVITISMFTGILAGGVTYYAIATDWYRVVDRPELQALAALREVSQPSDLVVASRGHHGNPIGWWVEGYALRQTYAGVDVRFLAFPEEREQALLANALFLERSSDTETLARLASLGARFLVVDRRGPDAGWLDRAPMGLFEIVYDSPTLVILKIA